MSTMTSPRTIELVRAVPVFGSHVELRVLVGAGQQHRAQAQLDQAESVLRDVQARLSRFDPESELSRLNYDPRPLVPASPLMLRFAEAVGWAGRRSGGLVDATLLDAVEGAGYTTDLDLSHVPSTTLPRTTLPPRAVPGIGGWRNVTATPSAVRRPPGTRLDSGGLAKGLAADLAAEALRGAPAWLVDCGGDLRVGGAAGSPRTVRVQDPVDPGHTIYELAVTSGGVATSSTMARRWQTPGGSAHHLIDPRTGRPADTGVVQVTALAPTALEAEVLAKAALLSGRIDAPGCLTHGGVIVDARGIVTVVAPPAIARTRNPTPTKFRSATGGGRSMFGPACSARARPHT